MKILFFADMHLRSASDRPKWRVDNHYIAQFNELQDISKIAVDNKVDLIISLGDFYDNVRVSHQLIADTLAWCKTLSCPIFSIVGNHDVNAYVTADRNNGLGVLFESGAIGQLDELIWADKKIIIRGVHVYLDPKQGNYMFDTKYDDYFKIVASHNFIIPHEVPFDAVLPSQVQTNADAIFLGHYHKAFQHQEGKTTFVNPGSVSRWSVNEQHQPQVFILDTETGMIGVATLKSSLPATEIFDLVGAAEMKNTEMNLQSFMDSLNSTSFENIDVEQVVLTEATRQGILKGILDMALAKVQQAKVELR